MVIIYLRSGKRSDERFGDAASSELTCESGRDHYRVVGGEVMSSPNIVEVEQEKCEPYHNDLRAPPL
jgi:hypothetical protein